MGLATIKEAIQDIKAGKFVIIVDDGVATGATLKAAVWTLRKEKVGRLVAALPVASRRAAEEISAMVDEWTCLHTPEDFLAVGGYYRDFSQTTDKEVIALLKEFGRWQASSPQSS